jgi:hypothetical protein
MFVPRALRLKGVKEAQKPEKQPAKSSAEYTTDTNHDILIAAMQKTSTASPSPQNEESRPNPVTRGSRFTTAPISAEYIAQLAAGIELIFTDYAHQCPESAKWLWERYRTVDGEEKCECWYGIISLMLTIAPVVHLTALLEHTNIATIKPRATQILLRQAMQEHTSANLQLSSNGFYVRRRPSTFPLSFIPQHAFSIVDDGGLSFWDQRTIYVEPHIRHLCKTPAKVAHWLQEHGQIKAKWLPVQAVQMLYNSCGFVVLSGSVIHEDTWKKWRSTEKPADWKIMTKVEHTKRTNEYLELLNKGRTESKRKLIAATEDEIVDTEDAGNAPGANVLKKVQLSTENKKRKRTKNRPTEDVQEHETTEVADDAAPNASVEEMGGCTD